MGRPILASLFSTSVLSAAILLAPPARAQTDYYFGDSDLEQGNYQIIAGLTADDRAPYFCKDGLCRDSNGPVWIEHVSHDVVPVLAATSPFASLNFAVSGAHMTERGDADLPVDTGVVRQIGGFGALQDAGDIQVGVSDRFFIHAGTNDFLRILEGERPETVQSAVVTAATANVATLAERGARTIVVAKVQPVQYLPLLGGVELTELRGLAADTVAATNTSLVASLTELKSTLPAGANIVLVDQPAFFEHLRRDYAQLGFSNFDEACYDPATGSLCSTDPAVQNRNVFFDGNHLSAAGHVLLADWYRATLRAASGESARSAGRMPDAVLAGASRITRETDAARQLMAGQGGGIFLFGAPILATVRSRDQAAGAELRKRQSGGLFGLQWPLGSRGFAALSVAHLDQQATFNPIDEFRSREWAFSGTTGLVLRGAALALHASYARPSITGFTRDAGALGLVATGETHAERYGVGMELGGIHQWGAVRLSTRSRLDYTHVSVEGFAERGAEGLALRYDRQTVHDLSIETEGRIGLAPDDRPGTISLAPFLQLRNRHRLSGGSHAITSTLLDNIANSATLHSDRLADDGLSLGGGFDIGLNGLASRVRIGVSYDRMMSGNRKGSDTAGLRLAVRF